MLEMVDIKEEKDIKKVKVFKIWNYNSVGRVLD